MLISNEGEEKFNTKAAQKWDKAGAERLGAKLGEGAWA